MSPNNQYMEKRFTEWSKLVYNWSNSNISYGSWFFKNERALRSIWNEGRIPEIKSISKPKSKII